MRDVSSEALRVLQYRLLPCTTGNGALLAPAGSAGHGWGEGTKEHRAVFRSDDCRLRGCAMTLKATLIGILLVTSCLPLRAKERMTLRVSPAVAFAPANLIVRTMVEANAQNRGIEIVAE